MKLLSALALLLSCLALCTDAKLADCNLTGQWKNDLGSNMTISAISENGLFWGTYWTAVTATNKTIVQSPLVGYQQVDGLPTFGFTVNWNFSNSITVFTGQCFRDETGHQVLQTTWLLRTGSRKAQDNWEQTRVGYNIFYPLPKKPEMKDYSPVP